MESSDNLPESQGMPIFRVDLTFKCLQSTSIAIYNAHASGSGSSGTCAGGHEVAIPAQPLTTSAQSLPKAPAPTPRPNEAPEQTSPL